MLQQWPACNMADRAPPIVGGLGTCSSRAKRGRSVAEDAGDPLHQAKRFHKTQEVCRCAHRLRRCFHWATVPATSDSRHVGRLALRSWLMACSA